MTGRGPKKTGARTIKRHISTPCGRSFSGRIETVNKLLEMHGKKCDKCSDLCLLTQPTKTIITAKGLPL
jgi:hypothetical protein